MYEDYLAHHGIKNQRWGVQHGPPYPVVRGSDGKPKTTSIVKSKLKAAMANRAANAEKHKVEVQQRTEKIKVQRAQREAERKADEFKRLKQRVIKHPADLYKFKDKFSRKEIEELINEIDFDRRVKDVKVAEVQRRIDSFKRFGDILQTSYNALNNVKNIYGIVADVNNAMVASGKSNGKPLPVFGSGGGKGQQQAQNSSQSQQKQQSQLKAQQQSKTKK